MMVSPAVSRDNGSVWLLSRLAVRIGSLLIAPAEAAPRATRNASIDGFRGLRNRASSDHGTVRRGYRRKH